MSASVRIDPDDPTPPYEQLRKQLAMLITAGTLPEGTRLAPVRQLAADLALATGTVARAYRELEAAGLVRTARGAGTRVSFAGSGLPPAEREAQLAVHATHYVESARLLGADEDAIRAAVDSALA